MSRFHRIRGLARSLAIYHAIPLRQRRLRRLYRSFVGPGDLVFDVGAHVGNRTRAFSALGCHVVAIEPQPDFARLLRLLFRTSTRVTVVETAVSDRPGPTPMSVSERTPTLSTVDLDWRDARRRDEVFARVSWNPPIEVVSTTLDALIERFGVPAFVKIDIEGAEPRALAGLSQPVPALSFEYLPGALDHAHACLTRVAALGAYEFNWSQGESYRLASDRWMTRAQLTESLVTPSGRQRSGDIYARHRVNP